MIFQLLAQILAGPVTPPPNVAPQLNPVVVLQRYATALAKIKEPRVLTFDYTLDQSGTRSLAQTHRVFRSGSNERDETLTVDGRTLTPPKIRIFLGRRNRYTISALAPRAAAYDFTFVGPRRNAHHFDYVFRLTPKTLSPFAVTEATIDGVRFLPSAIAFATGPNDGSGTITFGVNERWWVPYTASARATVADATASERLAFYTYRFPPTLPPSTFGRARPVQAPVSPGAVLPALDRTPVPVKLKKAPQLPPERALP